jgi:sulfur carrier protein ThiS
MLVVADHAEIIAPGDEVHVYVRRSPLRQERDHISVPAGLSISEIIDRCEIEPSRLYVSINGHSIEHAYWPRVRVKPGVSVNIVKVPGKGALRGVFGAVIAIAAALFAGPIAGTLFGLTAGTAAYATATGLIGAGITVTASVGRGRLFPVP